MAIPCKSARTLYFLPFLFAKVASFHFRDCYYRATEHQSPSMSKSMLRGVVKNKKARVLIVGAKNVAVPTKVSFYGWELK